MTLSLRGIESRLFKLSTKSGLYMIAQEQEHRSVGEAKAARLGKSSWAPPASLRDQLTDDPAELWVVPRRDNHSRMVSMIRCRGRVTVYAYA